MRSISRFIHDEEAADLIEYALLAGLISLAALASLKDIGTKVGGIFASIKTKLDGVTVPN
jgi:pilus assembly protein Flp/PilA